MNLAHIAAGFDDHANEHRGDAEVHREKQVQRAAATALHKLYYAATSPFFTPFSSVASVRTNGFPLSWKPCTLQPFITAAEPIHVWVLGGSSSAHAAKRCSFETYGSSTAAESADTANTSSTANDPFGGRYSNILSQQLSNDFEKMEGNHTLQFDVFNMAQGASDSVWNALMLDELVDAKLLHGADIMIVEYGINDALGGTTKKPFRTNRHLAQMMNMWLWRVWSLFHDAGRNPPPILFVYLWDADFYRSATTGESADISNSTSTIFGFEINKQQLLDRGVGQTSWRAQHIVLEHYRKLGWSIGAVNVGAVVDNKAVANDPGVLLDDKHHPNCIAMHAISAMIRNVLFEALTQCDPASSTTSQMQQQAFDRDLFLPMTIASSANHSSSLTSELSNLLLEKQVKVGSIMEWEPNAGSSSLTLGKESEYFNLSHVEADFGTKSYPWRADRKQSFTLPLCAESGTIYQQPPIQFTLLEPGLKWLGIGYHIFSQTDDGDHWTTIEMTINDNTIILSDDHAHNNRTVLEFDEVEIVKEWIRLRDYIQYPLLLPQCTLSFCYKSGHSRTYLNMESQLIDLDSNCPFESATSIEEVCDLWSKENVVLSASCPYALFEAVSDACLAWAGSELDRLEVALDENNIADQVTHPPQLNWLVGVIQTL